MERVRRREYLRYAGVAAGSPVVLPAVSASGRESDSSKQQRRRYGRRPPAPPTTLRVEYARAPVGIETQQPRLSWEFNTAYRGQNQLAYRILVATEAKRLTPGRADKWDSGKIESDQSIQIPYEGDQLDSGERVYWQVRVFDEADRPSPWSEPTSWEMGLLNERDWGADWIGAQTHSNRGQLKHWPNLQREWASYTVTVEFGIEDGSFGVIFRARDSYNFYLAEVDAAATPVTFRLRVREEGQWRTLTETPIPHVIPPNTLHDPHTIEIRITQTEERRSFAEVTRSELRTVIDDREVDRTADGTHPFGRIGLWVGDDAHAIVDAITASRPDGSTLYTDDFTTPDDTAMNYANGTITGGHLRLDDTGISLIHVFEPAVAHDPLLRTEVTFDKEVADARAFIAGLGFYELYMNGERVGDRVLDPGRTDYEMTVPYAVRDVTSHVTTGDNALGIALGRGRFGDFVPTQWTWDDAPWWSDPQLLFRLEVEFADGGTRTVVSDDSWRVTDGPTRYDSLMAGEAYDARRERTGWTTPDYDDSGWQPATPVDPPKGELRAQTMRPVTVTDSMDPVELEQPKPGVYVYDIGQQISGWTQITAAGDAGDDIKLTMGEQLNDDGTVQAITGANLTGDPTELHEQIERDGTVENGYETGVSNFTIAGDLQVDRYILAGDGTETWEPRFSYKGFRYVQIEGIGVPDNPTLETITAKAVHSPVERGIESDFSCSNELLDRIHENSRWAYLNNLQNVSTDTPTYEKAGWIGDNYLVSELSFFNFWTPKQHLKHLRDVRDAQVQAANVTWLLGPPGEGNVPVIAPTSNWGYYPGPWPALKVPYVLLPWALYRYFGDRRVLEEYYDTLLEFHENINSYAQDRLITSGLGDWCAPWLGATPGSVTGEDAGRSPTGAFLVSPQPPEGPAIVSTSYYYRQVRVLASMASVLGKEEDASAFRTLADDIQQSFNDEFLYPDDVYRTGQTTRSTPHHQQPVGTYRQTSNVFPLAWDLVPPDREEAVMGNLVEDIIRVHDGHLNTGVQGTQHILNVLSERGYHDVAYTIATRTTYPSWGYWIEEGDLTALAEWWSFAEARSLDHRFFGTIDEWFYKHLAGIQPAAPGFKQIDIAPKPVADLAWVACQTETIRGTVASKWHRNLDDARLALAVTIPGNTTATVKVPTGGNDAVRVREGDDVIWRNGEPADELPRGIGTVSRDGSTVIVTVGAGSYEFVVQPV